MVSSCKSVQSKTGPRFVVCVCSAKLCWIGDKATLKFKRHAALLKLHHQDHLDCVNRASSVHCNVMQEHSVVQRTAVSSQSFLQPFVALALAFRERFESLKKRPFWLLPGGCVIQR